MKFIGNYKKWLNPSWRQTVLDNQGIKSPKDWQSCINKNKYYQKSINAGYNFNSCLWHTYEKNILDINITQPPWIKNKFYWWIIKMNPGQFMPIHSDPKSIKENSMRYWIPLQDYTEGHLFIYKNKLITNYAEGDVYRYTNTYDIHGSANIGYEPRVILQITEIT